MMLLWVPSWAVAAGEEAHKLLATELEQEVAAAAAEVLLLLLRMRMVQTVAMIILGTQMTCFNSSCDTMYTTPLSKAIHPL